MTVREPTDSTEGVYITPSINSELDNYENCYKTVNMLSRIVETIREGEDRDQTKLSIADKLDRYCRQIETDNNYLKARNLGLIELEDSEIAPGFYFFTPPMRMQGEWIQRFRDKDKKQEIERGPSVLCWYISYSGRFSLEEFEYPFVKDRYSDLLEEFEGNGLDSALDIDIVSFYITYILPHWISPAEIGQVDPYLNEVDIYKIRGNYPSQQELPFSEDLN